jgi:serine/threonine protein kinase
MPFDLPETSFSKEIIHSRYDRIDLIGRGGMGEVHRVRDRQLQRELAMKVLSPMHSADPAFVDRFIEEAQIAAQLQHPGIVPIHDIGKLEDGRPFFTMKLVRGSTLESLLAARPQLSERPDYWLGIFLRVCQAVAFAHSKGVIHRDLKPSNIMVDRFGEVQVMDWGLAKILGMSAESRESRRPDAGGTHPTVYAETEDSSGVKADLIEDTSAQSFHQTIIRSIRYSPLEETSGSTVESLGWQTDAGSLTSQGYVVGTMAYMPPEQAQGCVDDLDARCDVFSLGAILSVILTGKPPYCGANSAEQHRMASEGELAPCLVRLRACPYDLPIVDLAIDCLSPDRQARPRDGSQLASRIDRYLTDVRDRLRKAELERAAADAQLEALIETGRLKRQRQKWARVAAVVIAASLLGAITSIFWIRQQRSDLRLALSNQKLFALEREQERNSRIEQSRLYLEQMAAPMQLMHEQLWETESVPTHAELKQISQYYLQTEAAYREADPLVQQQWDMGFWQSQIDRLHELAQLCNELPQPITGLWLTEKFSLALTETNATATDATATDVTETAQSGEAASEQLARALDSLPRWAEEHLTVAIASAAYRDQTIPVDWASELLRTEVERNLWASIQEVDLARLQEIASEETFSSLSLATQLEVAETLIHDGSERMASEALEQLEWIPIIPTQAVSESGVKIAVTDGGWIEAQAAPGFVCRISADLPANPINIFRLETYCGPPVEVPSEEQEEELEKENERHEESNHPESTSNPVSVLTTAPTVLPREMPKRVGPGLLDEGPNHCMIREIRLKRIHPEFSPENLRVQKFFSGHTTILGREADNALDSDPQKVWALGHANGAMLASTIFETRPVAATRYFPQLELEIHSHDFLLWQVTKLGRFRLYYSNQPTLPSEDHLLVAERILGRLNRVYPTNTRILGLQARAGISSGVLDKRNREAAIVLASTASSIDPYDKPAMVMFADLTLSLHPQITDPWYQRLITQVEAVPESTAAREAVQRIAAYQRDRGDRLFSMLPAAAREAYDEAERLAPESFHRHGRLAFGLARDDLTERGLAIARKGISSERVDWENLYYYGLLAVRNNAEQEAWLVFQQLMQDPRFESDIRLNILYGRLAFMSGATEEGIEILTGIGREIRQDPEIIIAAAIGLIKQSQYERLPWLLDFWRLNDSAKESESSLFSILRARWHAWGVIGFAAVHAGHDDYLKETLRQHSMTHSDLLDDAVICMDQLFLARTPPRADFVNLENSIKLTDVFRAVQPDDPRWVVRGALLAWLRGDGDQALAILQSLPFDPSDNGDSILQLPSLQNWQAMARVCLATIRVIDQIEDEEEKAFEIEAAQKCLGRVPEADRDLAEWLWWEYRLKKG